MLENATHERREVLDWERRIVGIARRKVPIIDEPLRKLVRRAKDVLVPRAPTATVVEFDRGEVLMDAHQPDNLGAHCASKHLGRHAVMSSRRQRLARVVEKRRDNKLGIGAGALGSRRRLERMLVIIDEQATVSSPQRLEKRQRNLRARPTGHAMKLPAEGAVGFVAR
jgi:hypothetical protein